MRTLTRAVRRMEGSGEPVPLPFLSWQKAGIGFWRGDLAMMAGAPGIGKSTVALTIGVRSGLPTLYFSADSSLATQSLRILSMVTGTPLRVIKERFDAEGEAFWDDPWVMRNMEQGKHIKWNFDASPSLATIDDEIAIFTEIYGEPPSFIVIDNAADIAFESGDEFSSLRTLMRELKLTARAINAAILVLHHTNWVPGEALCPPLHAIHGKTSQTPSVIVTLSQPNPGFLAACAVKNRNGQGDRTGERGIYMEFAPEQMHVRDHYA